MDMRSIVVRMKHSAIWDSGISKSKTRIVLRLLLLSSLGVEREGSAGYTEPSFLFHGHSGKDRRLFGCSPSASVLMYL
jgi:hypothetical protein